MEKDKIFNMLVKSTENDKFDMYIREVHLYSIDELSKMFEVKTVMGRVCEIDVYIDKDGSRYNKDYWNGISKLGKVKCIIEESPTDIKISTLDCKYQIHYALIKDIKQIRFDNFDYREGYVSFVGVNSLDGNDVAALEMKAMWEFHDMIINIKTKYNNEYTEECEFEIMDAIISKYDDWCIAGHREYPILSLSMLEGIGANCQIVIASLIYVNGIGNGGCSACNHFFTKAVELAKILGLAEGKSEEDLDTTLNFITEKSQLIKKD